ncbi:hypothetical protein K493DRAFT_383094 [Basidiobolus meristosporus CBS 931.73]|uniref:Uncharacterized protein n=1 Tax=Basidiobolus meristosporus CBS 931.73 TaxID=1314790 RepID=A0A1Y1XV06_9FUNG|nr:hypothetical protein K493DRAFT_383094 [Basidiobolus meristosporus CBS 931.73]|eukprot:ORX89326.1 hypothetical protein K493DRAFT_383094 [Basidiobolus meristosporus CBS 931.73]
MAKSWWTYAYLVDWAIVAALISVTIFFQHSYNSRPELGATVIEDAHTITIFGLYVITLVVPLISIVLHQGLASLWIYWVRRSEEESSIPVLHVLHNNLLGLVSSFGITAFVIEVLYMILSGVSLNDCQSSSNCTGESGKVYPSIYAGYTSLGMVYLSMYISRKSRFSHGSMLWSLVSMLPLLVIIVVCASQINQGQTTLLNVYFGSLIGIAMVIPCRRIYFCPDGQPRVISAEFPPRKDTLEEGGIYGKYTLSAAMSEHLPGSKSSSNRSCCAH